MKFKQIGKTDETRKGNGQIIYKQIVELEISRKEYNRLELLADRGYLTITNLIHCAINEGLTLIENRESGEE